MIGGLSSLLALRRRAQRPHRRRPAAPPREGARVDPREHRRHHRRGIDHRDRPRPRSSRSRSAASRSTASSTATISRGSAQGNGDSQPGQVVGKARTATAKAPDRAGDRPGVDYYETDVTLDELIDIMFEDLELPDLERKRAARDLVRPDRQAQGLSPRRHPRPPRQAPHRPRARASRKIATGERQRGAEPDRAGGRQARRRRRARFPFHDDDLTLPAS